VVLSESKVYGSQKDHLLVQHSVSSGAEFNAIEASGGNAGMAWLDLIVPGHA
jgi:hypothetical protein